MPTLATDIAGLAALGAPILCFDTCTVLDIMRDPTRETVHHHELRAALDLVTAMETGITLVGLVANQVRLEFNNHADAVADEADRELGKLRKKLARIDALAAVFGGAGRTDLRHLDEYVIRARAVADRLMAAAISVPGSPEIPSRALSRVNQARTPAQKGKESAKDCVVIETYLDVVSSLRAAGLTSKIVFVSSNTKDYAGETGRVLKPDIVADFEKIRMEYTPNLNFAKHSLGL
jgi:PIN domain